METYLREASGRVRPEEANVLGLMVAAAKTKMEETDGVWAGKVQQVCHKLVQGKEVYAYYGELSEKCQVGFGSAELGMLAAFSSGDLEQPQLAHDPTMTSPRLPC